MFFETKKDTTHTQVLPASDSVSVQTKLAIGAVNDPLEAEADAMADQVMSMSSLPVNTSAGSKSVQRKCAHCEEEEKEMVQRKPLASFIQRKETTSGAVASDSVSSMINSSRGNGSQMESNTKQFMESRFGIDFSGVNIHTGDYAVQLSRELNAQAFTVGNDIYFNSGKYNPASESGKHLLAHELTHTVQQGSSVQRKIQRVCTASAVCSAPISGSAGSFGTSELARESAARARRRGMTPARARATSHAGLARQLEIFVNGQDPSLLTNVRGIFVDQDLSPGTGALTQNCADWESEALPSGARLPRTSGKSKCIFVHGDLNQEALQFNTTTNATIGGVSRELWRIRTLQTFTHEVQHVIYDDAAHPAPAGVSAAGCTFANISSELTELNAIISEFVRIFRAVPAGAAATDPLNVELTRWLNSAATGGGEDIRGILTTMGCSCECDDVKKWVTDTFNFVTTSWTAAEKTAFNNGIRTRVPAWPL